jgi:hypothetical protein
MRRARFPNAAFAIILSCSMAASLRGHAQPQGQPLATEKHGRLAFLVGQWNEEVTRADARPGEEKSKGRWTARPVMGLYLSIQFGTIGPRGAYRAFGVLTYDQQQERYRLWWFDDAAGIGEYSGDFTDSNSLVMEHEGKVEGKVFRERIRFIRVSQDEVDTTIEQAWEKGAFKPYTAAVAHRVADAQAPSRPAQPLQH